MPCEQCWCIATTPNAHAEPTPGTRTDSGSLSEALAGLRLNPRPLMGERVPAGSPAATPQPAERPPVTSAGSNLGAPHV
jgi:hypothetical protein